MRIITLALVLMLGLDVASARVMKAWSYRELTDAADLIAIVTASKTRLRFEKAPLPDMSTIIAQRAETEFTVVAVLRGTPADPKRILLHHYADTRTGPVMNGQMVFGFEPKDKLQYLAFLKKGADGQYTPVTGQTDPWFSFEKLQNKAP